MKSNSHLTRAVFRAIITNRPYVAAECRRSIHQARPLRSTRRFIPVQQRRGLFTALLGAASRGFEGAKPTGKNLEIALGKLVDLMRARRTRTRPPSDDEILDAFKFIFSARLEVRRGLTRNEIYLVTETFKYFQDREMIGAGDGKPSLQKKDMDMVLSALALPSEKEKFRTDTSALAALVFEALSTTPDRLQAAADVSPDPEHILPIYITVLARTGSVMEALDLIRSSTSSVIQNNVRTWIEIMKGLANEGRVQEFSSIVDDLQKRSHAFDSAEYEELVSFFATSGRLDEAKQAYEVQVRNGVQPTTRESLSLLEICIRTKQLEWGQEHAKALEGKLNENGVMDSLFVWSALRLHSMDDIRGEINDILSSVSMGDQSMIPFNRLYEYGLQENRPELAALAIQVADSFDIRPNGKTYSLQLEHELRRGDLFAAGEVFDQFLREDMPEDGSDLPVLNKLVAALAFAPKLDYPLLMKVVDMLLERNADLDAEALAGLCRVFLQRDELEDITGLLRHRADFYSANDRSRISAVFCEFILDRTVGEQRAFNVYELFRHAFPETPPEERLPLMKSFFDRKRPDLACLVFGHMRQREDIEARPTSEAYAQCFAGIAQCRDIDGLQMVYNMLKLDLEVEVTTRIRNGLMLAYIACQMPYTAMIDHFWKILDSQEGPTYSTFEIALRACETWIPQGGYEARKIIAIMQVWNLEITKELYDCYVGALAGQAEFENTVELIEEMERDIGEGPDAMTIGAFYNAIPWQYRKDEVENWAKNAYPDLWEDLVAYGDEVDEEWEIRWFKIDRTIDIDDEPLFSRGQYDPLLSRKVVQTLEPPSD